jgi:hypothetical protein
MSRIAVHAGVALDPVTGTMGARSSFGDPFDQNFAR